MAVYLEFIASSPEGLGRLLGTLSSDRAQVELTEAGDLFVSIDLRESVAEPTGRIIDEALDGDALRNADGSPRKGVQPDDPRLLDTDGDGLVRDGAPVDPQPPVEGEGEASEPIPTADLPPRYAPGTCGGAILELLRSQGGDWPIAKIVKDASLSKFATGSVKTTVGSLVRDGYLRRVSTGVYAI